MKILQTRFQEKNKTMMGEYFIFLGGAREVLFIQEDRIELYIMKRKGFIRLEHKVLF